MRALSRVTLDQMLMPIAIAADRVGVRVGIIGLGLRLRLGLGVRG